MAGEGSRPLCVELGEKFEIKVLSVRKEESTRFRLAAAPSQWSGGFTLFETTPRSHGE